MKIIMVKKESMEDKSEEKKEQRMEIAKKIEKEDKKTIDGSTKKAKKGKRQNIKAGMKTINVIKEVKKKKNDKKWKLRQKTRKNEHVKTAVRTTGKNK